MPQLRGKGRATAASGGLLFSGLHILVLLIFGLLVFGPAAFLGLRLPFGMLARQPPLQLDSSLLRDPEKLILKWLLATVLVIEGLKFLIFIIRH
jgi:hypothetical protein